MLHICRVNFKILKNVSESNVCIAPKWSLQRPNLRFPQVSVRFSIILSERRKGNSRKDGIPPCNHVVYDMTLSNCCKIVPLLDPPMDWDLFKLFTLIDTLVIHPRKFQKPKAILLQFKQIQIITLLFSQKNCPFYYFHDFHFLTFEKLICFQRKT